jgi:hypothetical protein
LCDGSKFKAVNNRDKNFTRAKMERRMAQIEESVARYLQQLDTADRSDDAWFRRQLVGASVRRLSRALCDVYIAIDHLKVR